jgi:uncharacterized membrane protein
MATTEYSIFSKISSKSIKEHEIALFKNVSMNKEKQKEVEKMRKIALLLVLLLANLVMVHAQGPPGGTAAIITALCDLYNFLKNTLPVFGAVLIIFAAVIFAAGQVMGAETRARANVWATAMLTGALIGFAVAIIVPWFLDVIWGPGTISSACP